MGKFSFSKEERAHHKKKIQELFTRGKSFSVYPLKVVFARFPGKHNQVLISVPARTFKKAVDRNTIKRRIREGYRLNKALLLAPSTLCIAYIYAGKEVLPSPVIHQAVQSSFDRLNQHEKKN